MTLNDFSMPVHKSFLQADLLLGIPKSIFLILFLVFVLISYLFGIILGALLTVIFYVPCFILTKHDPHMLTVALNSLIEPDKLEG
ncbi:VirB3 family type IV secretion system protein [Treponema pectinovorum]|uniref:VirB3 family type IV secretion system protein n=1 Tax=Treponema pectinovorum TaxID=164 RepID=UPI0011F132D7|nr:VirB3 family type IV secretion system protein [Treponema pectinovorum]